MKHDLSKLHPKQQELYEAFQTDGNLPDVSDELYSFYLDLSTDIPDLIDMQESDMTKQQKARYKDFLKKHDKPVNITQWHNPNAVRKFKK